MFYVDASREAYVGHGSLGWEHMAASGRLRMACLLRRCLQGRWAYARPCARRQLLLATLFELSVRNGPCQAGHGGSLSGLRQRPPVFRDWIVRILRFGALYSFLGSLHHSFHGY